MSLADAVKSEVEDIDTNVKQWGCNGKFYNIPLMSGDLEAQAGFAPYADKFDEGNTGSPSELMKFLGEFMYELLKMKNAVDKAECKKIATLPNCKAVFEIWLGLELEK